MADKVQAQATQIPQVQQKEVQPKSSKKTIFFVVIPIVILQIIIAYLLVLDLNSKTTAEQTSSTVKDKETAKSSSDREVVDEYKVSDSEYFISHPEFLFVVKDLVVNPAGTGGLRYLLTSVGIEVTNEKAFAEIQSKEVVVNDILINILSSKTLEELSDVSRRKELRREIAKKVDEILTNGKVQNVYFSKFIIQ